MNGLGGRAAAVLALEPRVLWYGTRMDQAIEGQVVSSGTFVGFSGASLGVLQDLGGGHFRYTPYTGSIGTDHFSATFRMTQGYGQYTYSFDTIIQCEMVITLPHWAAPDESYTYNDLVTGTAYPDVNYFVLKGNTLTIPAEDGVLKNDADPDVFHYLTAHQVGSGIGTYGVFDIESDGSFTYTPNAGVFDNLPNEGLVDTCEYYNTDPLGNVGGTATVKVDLAGVYIKRDGIDVDTNPNQLTSWVGERIALSVGVKGQASLLGATFQWTLGGEPIDNYVEYPDHNRVVPMSAQELRYHSPDFYWWKKGTYATIANVVTATGQSGIDSTVFRIKSPSIQIIGNTTEVEMYQNPTTNIVKIQFANLSSLDGSKIDDGISFDSSTDPMAPAGDYRWTQTISTTMNVKYTNQTGQHEWNPTSSGLDHEPNFGVDSDSPKIEFEGNSIDSVDWNFSAQLYRMFKSDLRPDSIWVPLQDLSWLCHAKAERRPNGQWRFVGQPTNSNNPVGQDSDGYPEWTEVFENQPIAPPENG